MRHKTHELLILGFALSLGFSATGCGSGMGSSTATNPAAPAPITVSCSQEYYVSPTGTSGGDGSITSPWNLQTALNHPAAVQPGDCIWMRGGTYAGSFTSRLTGSSAAPIILRQYPNERATLDGSGSDKAVLAVGGAHAWYWGFEVLCSSWTRTTDQTGSWPPGLGCGEGVQTIQDVAHPGLKYINLIVHDTRQGFSLWSQMVDPEIHGNMSYYNGWSAPDRDHGHGVYMQNKDGTKLLTDNILFNQFGYNLQAYGSNAAFLNNFTLDGNTSFTASGEIANDGIEFLLGGGAPLLSLRFINNMTYRMGRDTTVSIGYYAGTTNTGGVVKNNYFVGRVSVYWWNDLSFTDNTVLDSNYQLIALQKRSTQSTFAYNWDNNRYVKRADYEPFMADLGIGWKNYDWTGWRQATGLDGASSYAATAPSGTRSFVRPNKYEPGRANITIYNWAKADTVQLDLSTVKNADGTLLLKAGDAYQLRNVQDYFNDVITGTYGGSAISVPMTGHTVAPIVNSSIAPPSTFPEFGVFVLIRVP